MKHHDRARRHAICASAATLFVILLATFAASTAAVASDQAKTALNDFEERLVAYLNLRLAVSEKLMPLAPTASGRDLAAQQTALATALRAARAAAKPGDLVPAPVAAQIHALILEDFKRRTAADERATFSEVPNVPQPAINRTYPASAALPTVPPLLLSRLPRLPDNLQYRFYGRHLVVLDADAQIIVDYIANVLPPH